MKELLYLIAWAIGLIIMLAGICLALAAPAILIIWLILKMAF